MSFATELADFLMGLRATDIPPIAIDHAEMLVASTIASAAMGSSLESSRIIRSVEFERSGKPESTVWFAPESKLPMAAAARINALMSDAAASDDSDLRNIVHQGTTACSVALAVGERMGSSGEDVLTAIVAGYEASGRISSALQCGFKDKGFHGCIVASFAAAMAASRLLKLSNEQAAHALALTATSIGGLGAAANTSTAREYHAGQAALVGVQAAQAAAKGYQSELNILEMKKGFLDVYGINPDRAAVSRGLGERWSILCDLGIKLVPGGHPHHAVAEAAANAAREGDVVAADVEAIEISRPGYQGFANPPFPKDLIEMAHSAMYFAAAGVADKDFNWSHASDERIKDATIGELLRKVSMVSPPEKELDRYLAGAIVTIRTTDGRIHSSTVYAPKGAAVLGISWADVHVKYSTLAPLGMAAENVEPSLQEIRRLRHAKSLSNLLVLLR